MKSYPDEILLHVVQQAFLMGNYVLDHPEAAIILLEATLKEVEEPSHRAMAESLLTVCKQLNLEERSHER